MCGIAGILSPAGVPTHSLQEMAHALRHRGPDGQGFALCSRDGKISAAGTLAGAASAQGPFTAGFAHTRLSIIDLSHASDQPMLAPDGRCALAYNGEIYNYLELKHTLIELGHEFHTTGDTEVVLHSYMQWGERCVERFVGMWAFAILDLSRTALLLSRDRFGIKPLYYWYAGNTFCFASEIKALRAVPRVEPEPDPTTVARYLSSGVVDDTDRTFFAGILQLPAAHNMTISLDGALRTRRWRYWEPPPNGCDEPVDDPIARFRAGLEASILLHLRSDVAVGTCLSGGLDSSSIVSLAAEMRASSRVPTYTHHGFGYVPHDARYSEQPYMDAVSRKAGAKLTYVRPSFARFKDMIVPVVRHHDEPFGSTSMVAQWFVFEQAREAGIKVMLDGQGADETLGGYPIYLRTLAVQLVRARRLLEFARFSAAHKRELGRTPISLRAVASSKAPRRVRALGAATHLMSPSVDDLAADLVRPELKTAELSPAQSTRASSLNELLARQTMSTSLPALLRVEDRNSMYHSIEARVPFLDHRLVELAFRLPPELKIHGARTKYVLREALAGVLPERVRTRTDKIGFRADPRVTWMLASEHRDAVVANRTTYEERWFEPSAVARVLDPTHGSPEQESLAWRVMNVKLWLRMNWGDPASLVALRRGRRSAR
jgi:asparagine synthase (glutamine-hydrolysing)